MFRIPYPIRTILYAFAILLFGSWLVLLCIEPVTIAPDSYGYLETAKRLTDASAPRPILFPLLLRITTLLHLKQSIVCYLIQVLSLVCFFWFCGPRKKLLSLTNVGVLIVFLMLPAIWSYTGTCLTESILFAVQLWIVIFLSLLFFPKRQTSLVMAILYSVAIGLLAILLKPWIMLFVVGCSVLFVLMAWFSKAFRAARKPALVLFIVTIGIFAFSYRYNMGKSTSSANIGYLLANSGIVDDLKVRLHEAKDTTNQEARFISQIIDDIQLLNTKYEGDPWVAPAAELKVLKFADKAYVDTINKAFKIAFLQRKEDVMKLMGLSVERYVQDTQLGLTCLDLCYGPFIKILKKNGVYFAIAFSVLIFIYWLIMRKRSSTAPLFRKPISAIGKQMLVFVGVLLFTSIFFALLLSISGGVELRRTVLPATFFQLIAISYLIINKHELLGQSSQTNTTSRSLQTSEGELTNV